MRQHHNLADARAESAQRCTATSHSEHVIDAANSTLSILLLLLLQPAGF
jgi:hypothetical protein